MRDRSEQTVGAPPKSPIFVVGAPRSGTTLLAAMLAAHPRLSCGRETHFYIALAKYDSPERLIASETWPHEAMAFLDGLRPEGVPICEQYGLCTSEIEHRLGGQAPSIRAILECLTSYHCTATGKERWIEKTPDHLAHVHEIRKHFPESPIVLIVRDPRDVALSLVKMPWQRAPRTFAEGLWRWKRHHDASGAFFRTDPNTHCLRYDDLVLSPETELRKLCGFLGEEFDAQMLDTSRSSRHFLSSTNSTWHRHLGKPLQRDRLDVWKRELSPEWNWFAEALVGDYLGRWRYERRECLDRYARVHPSLECVVKNADALTEREDVRRLRFWKQRARERVAARVCIGSPENGNWLGSGKWQRRARSAQYAAVIMCAKLNRRQVVWVSRHKVGRRTSKCGRLVARLLRFADVVA